MGRVRTTFTKNKSSDQLRLTLVFRAGDVWPRHVLSTPSVHALKFAALNASQLIALLVDMRTKGGHIDPAGSDEQITCDAPALTNPASQNLAPVWHACTNSDMIGSLYIRVRGRRPFANVHGGITNKIDRCLYTAR